ncbi:lipopolysaccharide kinase InaA family protein [Pararhodonellum marinum]|uniref:lipopolysaccharide kinase InaA family protein n=1 Tax=Pararhodonellum marinum TaxID=2755358 RepID=UPI0018905068|nr:lipopolysaccharide kinase InaA family protein [Pararhodonellum marinum]
MKQVVQINEHFMFLEAFLNGLPSVFNSMDGLIFKKRNTLKLQTIAGQKIVIKSYEKIYMANRFIYRFFRESKGKRAFTNASFFLSQGVNTPRPIAYLDCYSNWLFKSGYFICEYSDFQTLEYFQELDGKEKSKALFDLGNFIVDLHQKEIYHLDFSLSNILFKKVNGTYQFSLVDNNRVKIKRITLKRGVKSLIRLGLPNQDMIFLIEHYAHKRGLNESELLRIYFQYKFKQEVKYKRKTLLKKLRSKLYHFLQKVKYK